MKFEYVNPFLTSMVKVLTTMANIECSAGKAYLKKTMSAEGQVTGIMGLGGEKTKGSFAVSFTKPVILDITERMLGETLTTIDETVIDMVGELTNMSAGGAVAQLSQKGYDLNMGTPVVVSGESHHIDHSSKGPIIVVPFTTEAGDFFVEISFVTKD